MAMTTEVWDRSETKCADCGGQRVGYRGEAVVNGSTIAVYWAFLYDHPGNPEVFIDAIFGTWGVDDYVADHETFGSRTGKVVEHPHFASSLVTGGEMAPDDPMFGVKLTRDQALVHPGLETFWRVNDAILETEEIQLLLSGPAKKPRWPRWPRSR